jgi:hypothetical protein
MQSYRCLARLAARQQLATPSHRALSTTTLLRNKDQEGRIHPNADEYRQTQKEKPLNPHMTNTNPTINNKQELPKVGKDSAPPELISAVDPNATPADKRPENTERMTSGNQPGDPSKVSPSSDSDLGVGEMEGAAFKVEPLRRTGEDAITMRARLLCPFTSSPPDSPFGPLQMLPLVHPDQSPA